MDDKNEKKKGPKKLSLKKARLTDIAPKSEPKGGAAAQGKYKSYFCSRTNPGCSSSCADCSGFQAPQLDLGT